MILAFSAFEKIKNIFSNKSTVFEVCFHSGMAKSVGSFTNSALASKYEALNIPKNASWPLLINFIQNALC